ncbi:MAG: mannose-1-phosphate guanylyltransferase [Lentisphaeria bacterium]|nr:mannose-1-phosphate guanylyltransferase [Lentisphaeria bacterium]
MRVVVIMAGGSGERFWPVSRQKYPKQLLRLSAPDRTMLQEAVDHLLPVVPSEHVFVVTGSHLQEAIRQSGCGLPSENILAEPCKRNTAGCLAYAAAEILARLRLPPEQITMAVVTADHQIRDADAFRTTVRAALKAAEDQNAIITIGIHPTRPETAYGYIRQPENAEPVARIEARCPVYPVERFVEKPCAADAETMATDGRHLWNSGMFFWTIGTFLAEFERADPAFHKTILSIATALETGDPQEAAELFATLPDKSIDYALLEHASNVLVVPGRFGWDDIGSWDAMERTFDRDGLGNVSIGDPVLIDTENCIVYNAPGASSMAVACVGVRDLIVVTTPDGVLIVPKDRAQDVKKAVHALRDRGSTQL